MKTKVIDFVTVKDLRLFGNPKKEEILNMVHKAGDPDKTEWVVSINHNGNYIGTIPRKPSTARKQSLNILNEGYGVAVTFPVIIKEEKPYVVLSQRGEGASDNIGYLNAFGGGISEDSFNGV
ncbi:MAG: hypothetical protein ABIH39_09025, partial [Candidatus Margulisiibacteriota bacterium]